MGRGGCKFFHLPPSTRGLGGSFAQEVCACTFAPSGLYPSVCKPLCFMALSQSRGTPNPTGAGEGLRATSTLCCVSLWVSLVTFPTLSVLRMMALTPPKAPESLFFSAWTTFPCFTTRWESETGLTQLLPSLSREEFRGWKRTERCPKVIPQNLPPQEGNG